MKNPESRKYVFFARRMKYSAEHEAVSARKSRTFSVTQTQLCRRKVERRDGNNGTAVDVARLQLQVAERFFVTRQPCPSKLVLDSVCSLLRVFSFDCRDSIETSEPLCFLG